jgi:hypothetical protein
MKSYKFIMYKFNQNLFLATIKNYFITKFNSFILKEIKVLKFSTTNILM